MDAQVVDSGLSETPRTSWFAREKASGRIYQWATIGSAIALVAILAFSFIVLRREAEPGSMLSPAEIAALLIANLIPSIALMVLLSRRIANARAVSRGIGTGQLQPVPAQQPVNDGFDLQLSEHHPDAFVRPAAERREYVSAHRRT